MAKNSKVRGIAINDAFWNRVKACAEYLDVSPSAFMRFAASNLIREIEDRIDGKTSAKKD